MDGQVLAHYRILQKIGAGGMGEVYRAHDQQLDRDVAIKVLPAATFTDAIARLRLLREARAAAALNHPNICTVHEVGEADSQAYIAMELIEGQPLSACVGLSTDQVVRYGIQLADALAHAHDRGIVHRDLKPANAVILSDGRLKVLDFGLAKRAIESDSVDGSTHAMLTARGAIAGTLAYMAPEQLRGEQADARSDIWALGVVLCEISTGTLPFRGATPFELSSSILNDGPDTSRVPAELKAIIERCLRKEPGGRYQHAGEVRAALEAVQSGAAPRPVSRRGWWIGAAVAMVALVVAVTIFRSGVAGGPRLKSLAVLPFENLSNDPEQEYFVAGMHDAVITELSQINALRVISRTSAVKYKGSRKSVPEIARELNVDGIVEASVYRSGDALRVQVQLVEAKPEERHLWAQSFDRNVSDVLALHTEVAQAIAREIRGELAPHQEARVGRTRQVDRQAYEDFLRGMQQLNTSTPEGYKKGLAYLRQAVDRDAADPNAWAGLAIGYALVAHGSGEGSGPEGFMRARTAAQKALSLDENNAEAHGAMAEVKAYYEWDFEAARREYERALQLNPNLDETHRHFAWLHAAQWRMEDAFREMKRAQEINPLRPVVFSEMGWLHLYTGEYDAAIAEAKKALEVQPDARQALNVLGAAYCGKRMYAEAIATHEKLVAMSPNATGYLAITYARAGLKDQARALLPKVLELSRSHRDRVVIIARVYAALGDLDESFRWAERAYEQRNWTLPFLFHDHGFRHLRTDPRYRDLMRRIGGTPAGQQQKIAI